MKSKILYKYDKLSFLFYFIFFFSVYNIVKSTFLLPIDLLPSAKERLEFIQVYGVYLDPFTILGSFTYQGDNFQPGPFGYLFLLTLSYLVSAFTPLSSFIAALYIFEILFMIIFFYSCFIIKKYYSINMAFILLSLILLSIIPRSCYTLSTQCVLPMSPMPWYSLALISSLLVFYKSKNTFFAGMTILFSALMVQVHLVALPFSFSILAYTLYTLYHLNYFREFRYKFLFIFAILNWLIIFLNIFLSYERIYDKINDNSENKDIIFNYLLKNILYNFPIIDANSNNIIGNSSYQNLMIFLASVFILAPILLFLVNRNFFNKKLLMLFLVLTFINIITIYISYEEHQFNYNFGFIIFFITFLIANFFRIKFYCIGLALLAIVISFSNPFIAHSNRYDIEEFNDQRQLDDKTITILKKSGPVKITNFDFYNNNSAVFINFIYELIEYKVDFCLQPPAEAINRYLQVGYNMKGDGNGVQVLEIFSYLNCNNKSDISKYREIIMIPDQKQVMPKIIPGYKLLTYLPNTFWGKCYSEDIYALAKNYLYQPEIGKYLNPLEGVLLGSDSSFIDKKSYFTGDRYFCGFFSRVSFINNAFDTNEYFPAFPYFSQAIYIEDSSKVIKSSDNIIAINDRLNHAIMISRKVRNSEFEVPQFNSSINSYGAVEFYNLIVELFRSKSHEMSLEEAFLGYKNVFDSIDYDLTFTPNQVSFSSIHLPFFICKLNFSDVGVLDTPECGLSAYPDKRLSYFPNESSALDYDKLFTYLNNEIKEQIIVTMLNDFVYNYMVNGFHELEFFLSDNKERYSPFVYINTVTSKNFEVSYKKGYDIKKYNENLNILLDKYQINVDRIKELRELQNEINFSRVDDNILKNKREVLIDKIYNSQHDFQFALNNFNVLLREIYEYNRSYKKAYGVDIWESNIKGYEIFFNFYNSICAVNALKRYNFIYPKQYYYVISCQQR